MLRVATLLMILGLLFVAGCGGSAEETESSEGLLAVSSDTSDPREESSTEERETEETGGEELQGKSPEVGNLGDPCAADDDCGSFSGYPTCITTTLIKTLGLSDSAEVPGGYCSDMTCEASSECGEGQVQCVDLGASEVTDLFNICLKGCDEGGLCGEGQQCYCDEDGGILNTEGEAAFCTCMPEAIIDLLT